MTTRGVAFVKEAGYITKEQGTGKRRRFTGGGFNDAQLAAVNARGDGLQGGEVVDVLEAFAHGFQHDRELGVLPRNVQ